MTPAGNTATSRRGGVGSCARARVPSTSSAWGRSSTRPCSPGRRAGRHGDYRRARVIARAAARTAGAAPRAWADEARRRPLRRGARAPLCPRRRRRPRRPRRAGTRLLTDPGGRRPGKVTGWSRNAVRVSRTTHSH